MTKLTKRQTELLIAAASNASGELLSQSISRLRGIERSLASLTKQGLLRQRRLSGRAAAQSPNAKTAFRIFITEAGRDMIRRTAPPSTRMNLLADPPRRSPIEALTKKAMILALLERSGGAALPELAAATAWQPHTVRACLTRLRRQGQLISRETRNGVSHYSCK